MSDLRAHIVALLRGGSAHATLEQGLEGLTFQVAGLKPPNSPHTPWQLLEHIRIAQWDILEFTRNQHHVSPEFPAGYWPTAAKPLTPEVLSSSVAQTRADHAAFVQLVSNPGCDLLAPLPHDAQKTVLREALVLADHNAYHLGQLVLLRRALGNFD